MRLLIDILHPAHVHVFRNLASEMLAAGHDVVFTLREKDRTGELMRAYGFEYELLSHQRSGAALAIEFSERIIKMTGVVRRFRPHFMIGVMGPFIASVGRMRRILMGDKVRTMIVYGTEMARLTNWFAYPMANYVCTPDCYQGTVLGNHKPFPSYLSMAYLTPKRFTPDPEIVKAGGVEIHKPYYMVRFVSYEASHDLGTNGISLSKKYALIRMLEKRGRVLISSEKTLPADLEPYRLVAPAAHIHHFLYYASALVGESATMASECAVLGTPAFYISPVGRGFTDEQESRYGLVRNFTGADYDSDWLAEVQRTLDDDQFQSRIQAGHERLLSDKVDLTDWMMAFLQREYDIQHADTHSFQQNP